MSEKLKRLILITAIFVLALSLALVTVACDKPGADPKPEPEKQIVRLDAAPSADSDKTVSEGKFVLPEGQAVSFSVSDFAVKAVYSDGSEASITGGFSIDASSISENVTAGTYSVTITYGSHNAYVSVEVVTSLTPLPALDDSVEKRFSYEGTPFDLITELDAQREQADRIETLLSDGKISISTEENLGTRSATDAGDYMLCLVAAPGYAWVDQYGGNVTEKTFRWSIAKKIVPIPSVDGPTTFEYTGQVITLPVNLHGFGDHITLSNGVSETNQGIDANGEDGGYFCYAFIRDEDQNNYVFEGGMVGADVCSWKITPKKVAYPTLSGYQWSETRNGVEYYHYPYTGSEIAVATNLDNDPAFTVRKNAGGLIVDVYPFENGSYFVEIDLADQTKSGNYRWADGTRISAVSLNVVVDPIDYVLPSAVSSATLKASADYSSSGSFETIGANAFTEATRDLLADQEVWIDGVSDVTYNDGATYGAGVQTLQFLFKRSQNYKPLPIEIEVTINRAVVIVQSPAWYGPQNTTDSENVYDVGEGNFLYNGLPQRKELDLYYYSYALLDELLYAKVTYDVYYGTEEGVYGETPIAHNVVTSNDYGRYRFAYDGENSAAAGYYKTVATLSIDGGNYVFIDENQAEVTSVETTWKIEKAKLVLYPALGGTHYSNQGFIYQAGRNAEERPYGYYTGIDKTVVLNESETGLELADRYGNDGTPKAVSVTVADYVEIGELSHFVYDVGSATWIAALNTSETGKYKTTLGASLKEGLSANYELTVKESEWRIYSDTIDARSLAWVNLGQYAYGKGEPYVFNVPDGLSVWTSLDSDATYQGGNVGLNRKYCRVYASEFADGYEGVTILKPDSWIYNEPNHNISSTSEYTITKRVLTKDDFYMNVVINRPESPLPEIRKMTDDYEVGFEDGAGYYGDLGYDDMRDFGIMIERDVWADNLHGCISNEFERGEYTFSGFVWIQNATNGNYGFDETQDYVELLTEDYYWGEEEIVDYDSLSYKYILRFSFTWSIV
ncbi:MAG: hypothetical protein K5753_07200 [Clostridia bacterium]|nr:hypothetical protein [Clostridia bacterium]